jgi:hypothetical protein
MREPEYKRIKKKIETEYHEKLRALDMVFRMSNASLVKNGGQDARKSKGAVPQAVRNALHKITGEFTASDIESQIKTDDPTSIFKRASISSTLKRLAEDEEIICTTEGKGKRPSKYRRK